ncbi:anthranilate synthase component I family protein [Paenibacillus abyssi]|uniref:Para-aminobenzoate synthase n=1 Tax=Paenibacillus abyssi TaxID=1340531 RepID=A0A917G680_9BACL|nr:anthranilate synthase component I family protein [Paenibacillus abyssi]GGG24878.1 para-aminobenzoate synthase [Paenibacillus abyssi]
MVITPFEQWQAWHDAGQYTTLPFLYKQSLNRSAQRVHSWTRAWESASPHAVVLESGKTGKYTYLGLHPAAVIRGKGREAESVDIQTGERTSRLGEPLEVVREWLRPFKGPRLPEGPKWTGGIAGFWTYDIIRFIEKLPELAKDDLELPDYLFMRLDELWIIDHESDELYCAVHKGVPPGAGAQQLGTLYEEARLQAEQMARFWHEFTDPQGNSETILLTEKRLQFLGDEGLHIDVEAMKGLTSPFPKEDFKEAVRRIQSYISQGDVFQVNLSLRQSRELAVPPEELYEWLRMFNPSPYMGFLRCPDFQLVSASPELLVESRDGMLVTRPIAGTRRRGHSEEEDLQMEEELLSNEKERAEHIMLVDLERNDLGRISAYGTVKVKELLAIERYSHVMHLVSQVEGRLTEGKDAFDVIAATFPGGTITGAPKIRTMEIIEELEPVRRGTYTGSLGWIDYNGDMEFNIIIRTMTAKDGQVHIQAGAGIVIDSDPDREYYESLNKAKALWKAIEYSERFRETVHNH